MLSRTSLLDAQHNFEPHRCRHLFSRLLTRCQGRLLGRQVRSIYQITYPRAPFILLNLITSSFSSSQQHFRDTGDETCDGLSNLARALIGLAFCTYHRIVNPHHKIPPLYYLH